MTARALPVVTYHSIDGSGSPISIPPDEFRRQIDALAAAGWRTISISQALDGLAAGAWPDRSMLLTFDDGYASVAEHAAPALAARGFAGAIFVVSGHAGATNRWPGQPSWVPEAALLGWSDLRALAENGWTLGAHSRTHARLTTLAPHEALGEIIASKAEIEQQCGVAVEAFAYPYGARSPVVETLAAQHYRAIFGTRLACVTARSHRTNLERVDAYYLRGSSLVARLDSLQARMYLSARRLARAVRSRATV